MCYIRASQSEGLWQQCRKMRLRIRAASRTGLSLTSLPPVSSPSLLHQLIQAWSDTWASGVSVAIKMPPLQCFNWNFCCWCVNSCRTAKGRSIIPALRRPPEVKRQQLVWQENPQSSCLFMILLLHSCLRAVPFSHLHIHVVVKWLRKSKEEFGVAERNSQRGYIYRPNEGLTHTHTSWHTHTQSNTHTSVNPLLSLQTQIHYSFQNDSFFAPWLLAVVWCLTKGGAFLINADCGRKQKKPIFTLMPDITAVQAWNSAGGEIEFLTYYNLAHSGL